MLWLQHGKLPGKAVKTKPGILKITDLADVFIG